MEGKIHRMLDSLLAQTKKSFVIYVIDDGSKDKSKDIIVSYIQRFESNGVKLNYIYQQNAGAASAVNNALKYVNTKYFCLPDADDFYDVQYIEKCVDFLNSNLDCGIVFTKCNVFKENDLSKPCSFFKRSDHFKCERKKIFRDFYWDKDVYFCPNYMIRTDAFLSANGGYEIVGGKHGQNYQMILPMAYHSDFGYIDEFLYNYIIYKNSDSHGKRSLEQRFAHVDGGKDILMDVLNRIGVKESELDYYKKEIFQKNAIQKAYIACDYANRILLEKYYKIIDKKYLSSRLKLLFFVRNIPFSLQLYSFCKKIRGVFR